MKSWCRLLWICFLVFPCTTAFATPPAPAPKAKAHAVATTPKPAPTQKLTLSLAAMCESVEDLTPVGRAVVFSVSVGKVNCFTLFDPVPATTQIFHKWYHRDRLSTKIRLRVYPPRWATYSLIQLRETDKGPWRVEITDKQGHLLGTLRFSITD